MATLKLNNANNIKDIKGTTLGLSNAVQTVDPIAPRGSMGLPQALKFNAPKDINLTDLQTKARTPIFQNVTTERTYTPKVHREYTPYTNEEIARLQHATRIPVRGNLTGMEDRVKQNTEYALNELPGMYGFMEGFNPMSAKRQLERSIGQPIDTSEAEDSIAYKVGYGAGLMGQYAVTGGVAHGAVRGAVTKAIPKLAQNATLTQRVLGTMGASALADTLTGVPINTVQAIKESSVNDKVDWNKFAKSFAINTAIDVIFGGILEGGIALKNGRKIKTVGDLTNLTKAEAEEFTQKLLPAPEKVALLNEPQKQLPEPVFYADEMGRIDIDPNLSSSKNVITEQPYVQNELDVMIERPGGGLESTGKDFDFGWSNDDVNLVNQFIDLTQKQGVPPKTYLKAITNRLDNEYNEILKTVEDYHINYKPQGVELVPIFDELGDTQKKIRSSKNEQWYSDWWKSRKRAPTKQDKIAIAKKRLDEEIRTAQYSKSSEFVDPKFAADYNLINRLNEIFDKLPDDTLGVYLRDYDNMAAIIGKKTNIVKPDYTKKPLMDRIETPKRVYPGELLDGAKVPEKTLSGKKTITKSEPIILEAPQSIAKVETPIKAEEPQVNIEPKAEPTIQKSISDLPEDDMVKKYKEFEGDANEGGFMGDPVEISGIGAYAPVINGKGVRMDKDFARNLDAGLGKDTPQREFFDKHFTRPFEESKGKYYSAVKNKEDELFDVVEKGLGIRKKSKESAGVQWFGEGKKVVELDGIKQEVDYGLDDLKRDFPEKWGKIVKADEYFRKVYNGYIEKLNETLRNIYPDVENNVVRILLKNLEIKGGRKEYKALLDFNAGKKTLEELKMQFNYAMPNKKYAWQNIVEANQILKSADESNFLVKSISDSKLSKEVRYEINQIIKNRRLIPRKDYYRHFREMNQDSFLTAIGDVIHGATDIDPTLLNKTEFTKPKSKFTSMLQHRTKDLNYEADAVGGMLDYIKQAEYKVHVEPNIQVLRGIVKDLIIETAETRHANNFIQFLMDSANELAGKTARLDRAVFNFKYDSEARRIMNVTTKVMNLLKANAIVGNINSLLAQAYNLPNVLAYAKNPIDVGEGIYTAFKALAGNKEAKEILEKSNFLRGRYLTRNVRKFDHSVMKKTENLMAWSLEALDKAVADSAFVTFYKQNIKKGMNEADAVFRADELVKKSVAGRGLLEMPQSQRARLTKNFVPFTVEVRNAFNVYKEFSSDLAKGIQTRDKNLAMNGALGLTEIMALSFLMNEISEKLTGRRIVADYVDVIKERMIEEDEKPLNEKLLETAMGLGAEVITSLPGGQYVAGIAQTALGYTDYDMKQLFGDQDPTRFGTGPMIFTTVGEPIGQALLGKDVDVLSPATSFIPKFGGRQIERTIRGLQDMAVLPREKVNLTEGVSLEKQDFPASYSAGGNMRFTLDKTPGNYIKAGIAGTWATEEGKNYIKQKRLPLGDNQAEAVTSLGGGTEVEEFIRAFPRTGTIEQKRQVIYNSPFTSTEKQKLDRILINSKILPNYKSKEDYEFSLLPIEKKKRYTIGVASTGVPKSVYQDIVTNVDANNNGSITQSEAQEYIDKFGLTPEQASAVWKSINKSWKYNPYES